MSEANIKASFVYLFSCIKRKYLSRLAVNVQKNSDQIEAKKQRTLFLVLSAIIQEELTKSGEREREKKG